MARSPRHRCPSQFTLAVLAGVLMTVCVGCAAAPERHKTFDDIDEKQRAEQGGERDKELESLDRETIERERANIRSVGAELGLDVATPTDARDDVAVDGMTTRTTRDTSPSRVGDEANEEGFGFDRESQPNGGGESGGRGATAGADVEPPDAGERPGGNCERTCGLAQDLCRSSTTICEVADVHVEDREMAATCSWATKTCDDALDVCEQCQLPIVKGE